jgi:putative oxidoreductase
MLLQRLFSMFPNGWPGRGLLLLRLLTATIIFCRVAQHLSDSAHLASIVPNLIAACSALLLLVGLWTPVVGTAIAALGLWVVFSNGGEPSMPTVLAALGATLAMTGPGAWSIDAHLFGRKHFEIPER